MKKFRLVAFLFLFLLASLPAVAQDKVQLGIRFSNNEIDSLFEGLVSSEYTQGITVTGDFQVFKADGVRLGLSTQYARKSLGTTLDFYGAGPSFSVDAGKVVSVRGAAHFGITTAYGGDTKVFTRRYEVGPRLNIGKHLYLDPLVLTFTKSELLPITERGFEFGGGLRF